MRWLFLVIILIVFVSGCSSTTNQNVSNESKEVEGLKSQVETLKQDKELLLNRIDTLNKEIESLKNKSVSEPVEESSIDLSAWKRDEIINVIANYDSTFKNVSWFNYVYREDKHYYDVIGPIYDEDPFYDIRYKDRGEELSINRFRYFNLAPGNSTLALESYETDYLPLITKAQLVDSNLKCADKEECSGIKVIECTKESNKYHSWFATPYLFVTVNDNGKSLAAFKSFYCK